MTKRIELWLLIAVATVSTWHIVMRFSDADPWYVAAIQGAALSTLLAFFAHAIGDRRGYQRIVAFVALLAFALFSAAFQTAHFLAHGAPIWEAVSRGAWAPAAEVTLGVLLVRDAQPVQSATQRKPSRLSTLLDAAVDATTQRIAQSAAQPVTQMQAQPLTQSVAQRAQDDATHETQAQTQSAVDELNERQRAIVDALSDGVKSTGELCAIVEVSPNTLRNELRSMNGAIAQPARGQWGLKGKS